ncbi:MAG: FAD-dependent oxidoreductase [Aliiglaciecola sp.]
MIPHVETLIVGAGLSGLHLAMQLHSSGHSFQLVESRQRAGGRILTDEQSEVDLGPAWFWPAHTNMSKLVQHLSLQVFAQFTQGDGIFQTASGLQRIPQSLTEPSYRVVGGMGKLVDRICQTIPVKSLQIGAALTHVEHQDDQVKATFYSEKQGNFCLLCNKLVLAIPPRIVAKNIKFSPTLSANIVEQWRSVPTWMAGHAKAVLYFDKAHWRTSGFSGFAFSQTGPLAEIHDACTENCAALFGFFGLSADQRRQLSKDELDNLISKQIVSLFGHRPTQIRIHDWAKEEFTSTALDHSSAHLHPQYGSHSTSVWDGRVLLCSSECATHHGGYLEGALVSSNQAYRLLIQ